MKNITISVGIICKNEDRTIFNCLKAIQQQIEEYDEIIVVDTGSTDHTIEIIEGFRDVKLYTHKWNDDFSEARNVVISLSNNDWVFFIDSDEIIQSNGLNNLRKTIFEIEEVSSKPVVFCPKVLNSNDSIVYNSGRIIKNNGLFRFYGCIHEYPIYMNDINANNYSTIILDNTVMKHDGYADNIMIEKNKIRRNTELNKVMLEKFPSSDRYYYFYYRDARPLLPIEEYELAMTNFLIYFPSSSYKAEVYIDLISCLITQSKTKEAEDYLKNYWNSMKSEETFSQSGLVFLTVMNELQKIVKLQIELLETLKKTKLNIQSDLYRTIDKGYNFDDIIGYLHLSVGDFKTATRIDSELSSVGYTGTLRKTLEGYEGSGEEKC